MLRLGILGTGKIVQEFLPHLTELDFESVSILSTPRSVERAERLDGRDAQITTHSRMACLPCGFFSS